MNASKYLLAVVALTLAACGQDDRSSVWIQGRAVASDDCAYAPGGEFQLGRGVLDVGDQYAGFWRYQLPVYLRNDMEVPVGAGQSVTGNDFLVENVRVRVNPSDYVSRYRPNPPLLAFPFGAPARASVVHSGPPVEAGGGESATVIDVIPTDLGTVIRAAVDAAGGGVHPIVLGIAIEGRTTDGREIEVPEYFYPIDVCTGCLPAPACVAPAVLTSGSCGPPGQDVAAVCLDPTAPAP
jgi:hypothetical protein